MQIKREKKSSILIPIIIFAIVFYIALRIMTQIELNGGRFELEIINNVLDTIYKLNTPLSLTQKNLGISGVAALFSLMVYEAYRTSYKKNIQENTYGSAEWQSPSTLKNKKEKNIEDNIILTSTEQISKNMKVSHLNRHICIVGRPGTGKSKFFLEPNI